MSAIKPNHIASVLRLQAEALVKKASSSTGEPSTADGVVQVTKGTIPTDPGEDELKDGMPANGVMGDTTKTLETGFTNPSGTPAADKGAPAEMPKAASERARSLRNALFSNFPTLAKAAAEKAAAEKGAPAAPAEATPVASKSAAVAGELDLSPDMLIKLAKQILTTGEGVDFARYTMEKAAGAEAADEMIRNATAAARAHDESSYTKQAAFNEGMAKAAAIHAELVTLISDDDAGEILKQAGAHCDCLDAYAHPLLKRAYATGMEDGAALEEGAEAGAEEPAIPMGGEQLSMEDVVALLQEMIDSGEITEEDVVAGLSELQAGADPAADPAADSAADPAAAMAPEAAAV